MAPRLLHGLETEYAFSQFGEDGEVLERRNGLRRLLVAARKRLECLPDATSGGSLFLGNGSRLYIDAGNHPELSTPECTDPWQLVRYLKAGEEILIDLANDLDVSRGRGNRTRTSFFRTNVDYHSFATWGCHESYQYHDRAEAMSLELIPHFVSRIIYTGAGGFDDQSPGLEFVVSPRVAHLERVSSADSTSHRGIFHTKDEPLSHGGGWHRLHVLCGESLCGEVGSFLKVATTALIVRLVEHDACDGRAVKLHGPLASMRAFAADPECARSAAVTERQRMTAIEVQCHYLSAAEAGIGRPYMPDWAADVCRLWRVMLDRLEKHESRDGDVAYVLDWAIKRQLYAGYAERRGFGHTDVARYNQLALDVVEQLGRSSRKPLRPGGSNLLDSLPTVSKDHALARQIETVLQRHDIPLERFQAFLGLRAELCEIDTRFGELGERGVHTALERSGAIQASLASVGEAWLPEGLRGVEDVDRAKTEPPPEGRAHLRGNEIRLRSESYKTCSADWQAILDHERNQVYDLSDPFGEGARWRAHGDGMPSPRESRLRQTLLERLELARMR